MSKQFNIRHEVVNWKFYTKTSDGLFSPDNNIVYCDNPNCRNTAKDFDYKAKLFWCKPCRTKRQRYQKQIKKKIGGKSVCSILDELKFRQLTDNMYLTECETHVELINKLQYIINKETDKTKLSLNYWENREYFDKL